MGDRFLYDKYDYRLKWMTRSLNQKNYNLQERELISFLLSNFVLNQEIALDIREFKAPSTRLRNFSFPDSKISPSTRSIFKMNLPAHTHPMVSRFTQVPRAALQ